MKYLIIAMCLISCSVNAQQLIVKQIRVVCDAGQSPKIFNNPVDADNYAKTLPCATNNWVEMNYRYVRGSSSSSAKSSSSAPTSSSSASSASSSKPLTLYFDQPDYRPQMYAIKRMGGTLNIVAGKDKAMTYTPEQPFVNGEKVSVAAVYKQGDFYVYSEYVAAE